MIDLITEYSLWFLPLCILAGTALSYLMYTKKNVPWGIRLNQALFIGRAILLSALLILLLGPYIKSQKNIYEKPSIVLAVDNSSSIPLVTDTSIIEQSIEGLKSLGERLEDEDYTIEYRSFDGHIEPQALTGSFFNKETSNLSSLLNDVQIQYENKNLAGVVLLSDGIYNQGFSPAYSPYNMNIFAVGIGDTLPQTDLNLKAVYSNKITYTGNKFPLVAEVSNTGFTGQTAEIQLLHNGKILETKKLTFKQENGLQQVKFLVLAEKKGMQRFVVKIVPKKEEFTKQNNEKNLYIDVLDGKEKILLVAASPHPDIKTLRSAIEKNKNYELHIHIPNIKGDGFKKFNPKEKYGMAILHQIPDKKGIGNTILKQLKEKKVPIWYILGNQSNINVFNQNNSLISISASSSQKDKVTGVFNNKFTLFNFDTEKAKVINKLPPVSVPFGKIKVGGGVEVLLNQRVGSITTEKPLLVAGEQNGYKSAVMLGDGLWLWRLQEFLYDNNQQAVDEMIGKLVQYMATQEDRRKFRVYPVSEEFTTSESALFATEVYNNIYEKIYGQKVDLVITDELGEKTSFTYENSHADFKYAINDLKEGVYTFKATTTLNGKTETSSGEFTVKTLTLEAMKTTADFNMLRNLSKQSGGDFFLANELSRLGDVLKQNKPADIIHTQEQYEELSSLEWILAVLLLLATIEWVVRKVKGGY